MKGLFGWLFTGYWLSFAVNYCEFVLVCFDKTHKTGSENQSIPKAKTAYLVIVMLMVVAKSNLSLSSLSN